MHCWSDSVLRPEVSFKVRSVLPVSAHVLLEADVALVLALVELVQETGPGGRLEHLVNHRRHLLREIGVLFETPVVRPVASMILSCLKVLHMFLASNISRLVIAV